jgi:hypothetical protein
MKTMNKVIALIIMMTITIAMPAMAGNGKKNPNGKRDNVVVVNNGRRDVHGPRADMHDPHGPKADMHNPHGPRVDVRDPRFDAPRHPIYRPDMRTCVIKLSRHDSHRKVLDKVERMKGVMDADWSPRTREVIVRYDANVTSARHILRYI